MRDPEIARGQYSNEVGEAIYQCRLTIAELARRLGMARQDLSEIVNGWRLPSAEQLDAICTVVGWTREQLYPRDEFRLAIEATRRAAEPA